MSEKSINIRYYKCLEDIGNIRKEIHRLVSIIENVNSIADLPIKCRKLLIRSLKHEIVKLEKRMITLRALKEKLQIQQLGFWSAQPWRIRELIQERDYWKNKFVKAEIEVLELENTLGISRNY